MKTLETALSNFASDLETFGDTYAVATLMGLEEYQERREQEELDRQMECHMKQEFFFEAAKQGLSMEGANKLLEVLDLVA